MLDLEQAARDLDHLDTGVAAMAWAIVKREGGLANNPNDPGGITNYGVSLRHARAQGLAFDLDHDGDVDADDIRLVTPEIAVVDFLECFFIEPGINKLPACMQACVFDHAVNGGPCAGVRVAQTAINVCGGNIKVDGVIGPNTIIAANRAVDKVGSQTMLNAVIDAREGAYRWIAAHNPKLAVFLKGWLNRAESFRPGKSSPAVPVPVAHADHPVAHTAPVVHAAPAPAPAPAACDDNVSDDLNQRELDRIHAENG